ncbi:MAG: Uncharacterized protein CEO21_240 [Microgenomates group bacterium Gr01-1014_80]|nr:MAG: Uncharacterized protein CEO21_240 [Microgenomates group bacterium Gr01-1014_80]
MKKDKLITNLAILYFILGLIFATGYAAYYKWTALAFLSPGFYAVVLTWPLQISGFFNDFINFGLAGKPI